MKTVFVIGGTSFIGSHFTRLIAEKHASYRIVIIDCNRLHLNRGDEKENVSDIDGVLLESCDLKSPDDLRILFSKYEANIVVNFAASINTKGIYNLLECCKEYSTVERFVQTSTGEVYGEVIEGAAKETNAICTRSHYAAAKLAAEQLALSYFYMYDVPVVVTRSSNNYGPNQEADTLIPIIISKSLKDEDFPLYGDGEQIRNWIHVLDNCRALDVVMNFGQAGEIYNISSSFMMQDIDLAKKILKKLDKNNALICRMDALSGQIMRSFLDNSKVRALGWRPEIDFEDGLNETIEWYKKRIDE